MTTPDTRILRQHILEQEQACDALLNLLSRECDLLKNRDALQLDTLTLQKLPFIQQLEAGRNLRGQWLQQQQLTASNDHWCQLLETSGEPDLLDSWHALSDKFLQCQHQNTVNGKMVNRGKQSLHQLLQIVRGQSNAPKLYTAGGSTQTHISQQAFVKA